MLTDGTRRGLVNVDLERRKRMTEDRALLQPNMAVCANLFSIGTASSSDLVPANNSESLVDIELATASSCA
jgi:hypothetical protein